MDEGSAPSERTFVAMGCSTRRDYAFPLPLTCLLWREVVGYEPLALLVGSPGEWKAGRRVILSALDELLIEHIFVPRVGDYEDPTLAQSVRQHAACHPGIPPAAWIMMSDADLWPIRREFYRQHEGTSYRAVCYYSNGDGFRGKEDVLERLRLEVDFQSIPTCHVALRARDWRALYGLRPNGIAECLKRTLDGWIGPRTAGRSEEQIGWETWMADQRILTSKLCREPWFPEEALLVERRHPIADRLDRSMPELWDGPFDPSRWIDAHLPKDLDEERRWGTIVRIFEAVLPARAAFAKAYHAAWVPTRGY